MLTNLFSFSKYAYVLPLILRGYDVYAWKIFISFQKVFFEINHFFGLKMVNLML